MESTPPLSHTPALTFPNAEPEVCPFPLLCIWLVGWFEIGIHCVAQAGLELTMKAGPPSYSRAIPPPQLQSITDMCHNGLCTGFLILVSSLQTSSLSISHPFATLKDVERQVWLQDPFLMVTLTFSSQDGVAMLLIQQGF